MEKHHRPSKIDKFLSAHPEKADAVRAIMVDPGLEVDEQLVRIIALGCKTSRSAVARFRLRFVNRQPGPPSTRRVRLLELVSQLDDAQIDRAVTALEALIK